MTSRAAAEKARRDARRDLERASAEAVVDAWLARGALAPGRYLAADLYAAARRSLLRAREARKTLPDGRSYGIPGQRTFYAVADARLGASTKSNAGRVYTISPKELPMTRPSMSEAVRGLREARLSVEAALASSAGTLTLVIDDEPVRLLDAALTDTGLVGWPA